MGKLLPDRLKELWGSVDRGERTVEEFNAEQERFFAEYRNIWEEGMLLEGFQDLEESILAELGRYMKCENPEEMRLRCSRALSDVKGEWMGKAAGGGGRDSIERFYNESQAMIFELMWWHSLSEDMSPMAYVVALHFAREHGCRRYLDFGAGVGSGGLVFARKGLEVTLADISSSMLDFSRWRFNQRKLPARFLDLKISSLPDNAFDMIAVMDVFEHLVDPVGTVDELARALKSKGYIFGRLHAEEDEDRPQHIVRDFGPTLERMRSLGFVEVWRDEWLWGHQIFQKS